MTANEFFTNLNGGARWDVGVSINRSNKLPLDANSVFPSLAEAQAYVAGTHPTRLSNAYPGQILSVVTEDGKTKIYATELNAEGALVLVNFAATDDVPEVIHPEYQMVDISSTLTDEEKKTIAKRYALTKDGTQLTVKIDIPQVPEVIHPEYEVKALALTDDDVAAGVALKFALYKDDVQVGDAFTIPEVVHPEYSLKEVTLTDAEKATIAKRFAITKDGVAVTGAPTIDIPVVVHPDYSVTEGVLTEADTAKGVAKKYVLSKTDADETTDAGVAIEIPAIPEYEIKASEGALSEGILASYYLAKDGVQTGVKIDIPKDLLVRDGAVVTFKTGDTIPEGLTEGTYIKLVLNQLGDTDAGEPIYIPADSLIEYVTSGSDAAKDTVIITVSDDYKVSASIRAGSITQDMLVADLSNKINAAHAAIHGHDNKESLDKVTADDVTTLLRFTAQSFEDADVARLKSITDDHLANASAYEAKAQAMMKILLGKKADSSIERAEFTADDIEHLRLYTGANREAYLSKLDLLVNETLSEGDIAYLRTFSTSKNKNSYLTKLDILVDNAFTKDDIDHLRLYTGENREDYLGKLDLLVEKDLNEDDIYSLQLISGKNQTIARLFGDEDAGIVGITDDDVARLRDYTLDLAVLRIHNIPGYSQPDGIPSGLIVGLDSEIYSAGSIAAGRGAKAGNRYFEVSVRKHDPLTLYLESTEGLENYIDSTLIGGIQDPTTGDEYADYIGTLGSIIDANNIVVNPSIGLLDRITGGHTITRIMFEQHPELGNRESSPSFAQGYNVHAIEGGHAEGFSTKAFGRGAHAEGINSLATAEASHAEGSGTANGNYSHAEGSGTANGEYSHAEGDGSIASAYASHAEGYGSKASGYASHAEGSGSKASGYASHAEGSATASAEYAHAEGSATVNAGANHSHAEGSATVNARAKYSHAEGSATVNANANYSHAEGGSTTSGIYSHAEGEGAVAVGRGAHAEGRAAAANGDYSHAESNSTASGDHSHAEGDGSTAGGYASHAEGAATVSAGASYAHAEGYANVSAGANYAHAEGYAIVDEDAMYAHAEGYGSKATGNASHAEGESAIAVGSGAHAEGIHTYAQGTGAHAEGIYAEVADDKHNSAANYEAAHAEGYYTRASAKYAHAEGYETHANAEGSHSEGSNTLTESTAKYAHAEGIGNVATAEAQHVSGKYNAYADNQIDDKAVVVGGGSSTDDRKNIYTLDWDGNAVFAGNVSAPNITNLAKDLDTAEEDLKFVLKKLNGVASVLQYGGVFTELPNLTDIELGTTTVKNTAGADVILDKGLLIIFNRNNDDASDDTEYVLEVNAEGTPVWTGLGSPDIHSQKIRELTLALQNATSAIDGVKYAPEISVIRAQCITHNSARIISEFKLGEVVHLKPNCEKFSIQFKVEGQVATANHEDYAISVKRVTLGGLEEVGATVNYVTDTDEYVVTITLPATDVYPDNNIYEICATYTPGGTTVTKRVPITRDLPVLYGYDKNTVAIADDDIELFKTVSELTIYSYDNSVDFLPEHSDKYFGFIAVPANKRLKKIRAEGVAFDMPCTEVIGITDAENHMIETTLPNGLAVSIPAYSAYKFYYVPYAVTGDLSLEFTVFGSETIEG